MKKLLCVLVTLVLVAGCNSKFSNQVVQLWNSEPPPYRWVGDIKDDPSMDDPTFEICGGDDNVAQYFHFSQGLQIVGEQRAIQDTFQEDYQPVDLDQSGWIRIRFIVNCKGETGRFRLTGSDENYAAFEFDPMITEQLLRITQKLKGWAIHENQYGSLNYYQYLVFVMEKGEIKEILP